MFSNKKSLLMKNILTISFAHAKNSMRINLLNNGLVVKRFSVHVGNSHQDSHATEHGQSNGHHENHEDHHDDHHGHHEITGEVDLNKVYVPLSADVIY